MSLRKVTLFSKKEETPPKSHIIIKVIIENYTIRFGVSENLAEEVSSSYLQIWNFLFFARRKGPDADLFVFLSRGDRINPVVLECPKRTHSNKS